MKNENIMRVVIGYMAMSFIISLLALALLYPLHPVSVVGTMIWFFAALPICLVGEGVGSLIFGDKVGKFINKNTSKTSIGRIGYGVLVMSVFLLISIVVANTFDSASIHSLRPIFRMNGNEYNNKIKRDRRNRRPRI